MSARPTRRAARAVSTYAESPTRSTFPPSAPVETNNTSSDAQNMSASAASETPTAGSDRNSSSSATHPPRGTTSSTRGARGSRGGKRGGGRWQLTSPNKGSRQPKSPSDLEHESGGADVAQETSSAVAVAAGPSISVQGPTQVRSSATVPGGIPSGQTGQALVSHVQYCLNIVGDFIDHDESDHPGTAYSSAIDSIARLVDELLHKCKRPARFNRASEGGPTMVDQAVQADSNTPAGVMQALSVIVPPPTLAFASQLTSPPPPGSTLANMVLDAQAQTAAAARASQQHCHSAPHACTSCSCACHASTAAAAGPSSVALASRQTSALAPSRDPLPPTCALDASTLVNRNSNAPRGLTTQNGMGQKQDPHGAKLVHAGNEAQQLPMSTHSCQVRQHLEVSQASMPRRHGQFADQYGDTTSRCAPGPLSPTADSPAARSSAAHRLLGIRTANAESAGAAQSGNESTLRARDSLSQSQDQHALSIRHDAASPRRGDSPAHDYGHVDSPSFLGNAAARAVDPRLGYQIGEHSPNHSPEFDGSHQGGMGRSRYSNSSDPAARSYLPPMPTGAEYGHQSEAGVNGVNQESTEPPRKRARTSQYQAFSSGNEGEGSPLHHPQHVGAPPIPDRPDPEIVRSWASLSAACNPTDPALMASPWQNTPSAATTLDSSSSSYYDVQRTINSAAGNALASASSSASPNVGMPMSRSDLRHDSVELSAGGLSPGPDGDDGYDFSMFGPDFTEHGSPNPSQYTPDGGSMPLHMPGALDNGRIVRRRLAQFKMSALKASYAMSPYPDRMERARLCRELGLEDKTITIWFNNQRKLHRERLRRAGIHAHGRSELPALPTHPQTLPRFHSFVNSPSKAKSAPANDHPHTFDSQSDFLSSYPSSAVDGSSESPQVDHSQSQRLSNGVPIGPSTDPYSLPAPVAPAGSVHQSPIVGATCGEGVPFLPAIAPSAQSDLSQSLHQSHQVSDYMFPKPSTSSPIPALQGYISVVNAPPSAVSHDPHSASRAFPSPTVGHQSQPMYPAPVAPPTNSVAPSYYQVPPPHHPQQRDFHSSLQQPQTTHLANGSGYGDALPQQSPFSPSYVPPSFHEQEYVQEPASSDNASLSAAASTPPTPAATPAPRSRRRSRHLSNMSNKSNRGDGASSDNPQAVPFTSPPPSGSTNTNIRGRWTPQELEALRLAVLRHGRDWAAIHAAHGPEGTVDQSLGRLPSVRALRQKAYRLGLHSGSDAWLNEPFSEE